MSTRSSTYVSFENNVRYMDLIAWLCSQQLAKAGFNQILLDEYACHIRNDVTEGFCQPSSSGYILSLFGAPVQHLKYGKFQDNFSMTCFPLVFAPWECRNAAPHRSRRLNDSNHRNIPSKKSSSSSQAASGQDLEPWQFLCLTQFLFLTHAFLGSLVGYDVDKLLGTNS